MNKYVPLHCHSHFSMLDGASRPSDNIERAKDINSPALALTDHGTISGCVEFLKKAEKIKPLLGCELYVSPQNAKIKEESNRKLIHMPVIAKNDRGWLKLVKMISAANHKDNYYYKPRLSLDEYAQYFSGEIMGFSGHLGSHMANAVMNDDWERNGVQQANLMRDMFGPENFYLEVQLMDRHNTPEMVKVAEKIRTISKKTGIPCVATPDAHYAHKGQAILQRILLCKNMNLKMRDGKSSALSTFFKSDNFHIPSYEEMIEYGHTEEELRNTLEFADKVEKYEQILKTPEIPPFPVPEGHDTASYLRELCRQGWSKRIAQTVSQELHAEYADRVKKELDVFEKNNLSGYFLICADIINFVRENGWLPGVARGSAGGCLVSYLVGITDLDPIPYGLLFERFFNEARAGSLPDIDMDVPVGHIRDSVIQYIRDKYGHDRVGQMATFGRLQGRAALKETLRAFNAVSFDEMNLISKNIPDEAKISDDLQTMKEETGESSIIRWALENTPDKFSEWVYIGNDGQLEGDLAYYFDLAIKLEGTICSTGKHAAGVIIGCDILSKSCVMVYNKDTKENDICGFDMGACEDIGLVKMDVLGTAVLNKVMGVKEILKNGKINI